MVDAATEFKKSGYDDDDAAMLALMASRYQNVADEAISAGESANFIISQMKAFNIPASEAEHVIDAVNEVANKFAVSSADLATNIGKASAALAVGNNSYEQTLGLLTGITEITRSGSRASRSLVSVQSRLNQITDESSSTGQKLIQWYKEQNIAITDEAGQLRSLYDILSDVAQIWPTLTTNQRDYYLNIQAGANQSQNLAAALSNFETVAEATATALDSSGSALEENARYMESLEAKTQQLRATFQDLANNIIDNELLKSLLDLVNNGLKLANTEIGQLLTTFGLTSGVAVGAVTIFGTIATKLSQMAVAGTAFTSSVLPWALLIGGAVAGFKLLWDATEDYRMSLEDVTGTLESNTEQLRLNEERLKEINNMSWSDKTPEILDEKEALKQQNAELRDQIEYYQELQKQKAEQFMGSRTVSRGAGEFVFHSEPGAPLVPGIYGSEEQAYEALAVQLNMVGQSMEAVKAEAEELGIALVETQETVGVTAEEYKTGLITEAERLTLAMKANADMTDEQRQRYNELLTELQTLSNAEEVLGQSNEDTLQSISSLTAASEEYSRAQELSATVTALNSLQAEQLKSKYPELANSIEQVNGKYFLLRSTAVQTANALIQANGQLLESDKERVDDTLELLAIELEARANIVKAAMAAYNTTRSEEDEAKWIAAARVWDETRAAQDALRVAQARSNRLGWVAPDTLGIGGGGSTSTGTWKDPALERFKALQSDIEHLRETGVITEAQYYDELEKLIQEYIQNARQYIGTHYADEQAMLRNMYEYEEEIYKGRQAMEEARQEQLKETLELEKEQLEIKKSELDQVISYATTLADRQIQALDDQMTELSNQIDTVNKKYDDQIQALQDANDELDNQIQKEQLLQALAQAQSQKQLVFKDGAFQYVEDLDAVAAAQGDLAAYNREQALQDKINLLEQERDAELKALEDSKLVLEEEKKQWEEYRDGWANLVSDYEFSQNELLASQRYGIDLEKANWEERKANLEEFKQTYINTLEEIQGVQDRLNNLGQGGTSGGGSSSGRGWSISGSANTERDWYKEALGYAAAGDLDAAQEAWNKRGQKVEATGKDYGTSQAEAWKNITAAYEQSGKAHALGTLSAPGGLSLVGEHGPELRVLGNGDGVIPANITRNLWNWGSMNPATLMANGGLGNTIIDIANLTLPNVNDAQSLVNGLKQLAYQRAYKRA